MKKTILLPMLLAAVWLAGTSCSDDDAPHDPADAVALNMLDEENGKTLLGESDVYINNANNFHGSQSLIAEVGRSNGVGAASAPRLENLVREAAVTPGHLYQVFDARTIRDFPSGTRAVLADAGYYRLYVESALTGPNGVTGARIKYVLVYPDKRGLPDDGYLLGQVSHPLESVAYELPADAECFWYDSVPEVFDIAISNGTLQMSLKMTPTEFNGITGDYEIYIRRGDVFTCVRVRVTR